MIEENKKYKYKIVELRDKIKNLEQKEKKLKNLIVEKEDLIDEERLEFNTMLESDHSNNQISISNFDLVQSQGQYSQFSKSAKRENGNNLEEDFLVEDVDTIESQVSARTKNLFLKKLN